MGEKVRRSDADERANITLDVGLNIGLGQDVEMGEVDRRKHRPLVDPYISIHVSIGTNWLYSYSYTLHTYVEAIRSTVTCYSSSKPELQLQLHGNGGGDTRIQFTKILNRKDELSPIFMDE
jgi:hypothetical protein